MPQSPKNDETLNNGPQVVLVPRGLRRLSTSYSVADLVTVSLIAAIVSVWVSVARGSFSVRAFVVCEVTFFAYYLVGSLFAAWKELATGVRFELPLRLLFGYAAINTALLALAWLSPLGVVANFVIVLGIALFFLSSMRKPKQTRGNLASQWAIGLCLLATTLWCQDSINPTVEEGKHVIFKPWVDGFYHAVHVRIFAESHGASTIEDFRMTQVPARLYHYGVYMLPALIKQAAGIHSYTAFAAVLAPVGVFFTGLAAYSFFASLWGAWPGAAAAAALLLLPDANQQGMQNAFMSYHWLTQISPSATYGLALLAIAWLFIFQGCKRGSRLQLCVGWLFAAILVAYKLHYVVASALLLLLVPALFFRARLGPYKRASWVVAACLFYVAALTIGQRVPGVPLISFDGSSIAETLHLVQRFATPGAFKETVSQYMGREVSWSSNLLLGIPYVLCAALGVFVPLLVVLMVCLRRRTPLLYLVFPLLLIANFLAMFFGLALDFESSTPDELLHRPVMIVYFFVVAWVGGALGLTIVKSPRLARLARPAIVGVALLLMAVPTLFGRGVQLFWAMPRISPVRVPTSLVQVAEYLRTHGSAEDIFQDSLFDRNHAIAALSERRPFVSHTMTHMPFRGTMVAARTAAVDRIMFMHQPKLAVGTLRTFGIRWFILQRGNKVRWPAEITDNPAFQRGGVAVYEF